MIDIDVDFENLVTTLHKHKERSRGKCCRVVLDLEFIDTFLARHDLDVERDLLADVDRTMRETPGGKA